MELLSHQVSLKPLGVNGAELQDGEEVSAVSGA
jgi:hypothetical protein